MAKKTTPAGDDTPGLVLATWRLPEDGYHWYQEAIIGDRIETMEWSPWKLCLMKEGMVHFFDLTSLSLSETVSRGGLRFGPMIERGPDGEKVTVFCVNTGRVKMVLAGGRYNRPSPEKSKEECGDDEE